MIYLFIFLYLLYLTIHYDILEKKAYKWIHYNIVIILLILVAGLRWRVGSDTVQYAQDFYYCHDLLHLELADFESINRMPFWVLLNATCKSIWNNFVLVQLVVSTISLGATGYFIKKVSPSVCFFVLLCYYLSRFTALQMEVMRESMAVSFFLLGILAINEKKYRRALMFSICAIMFQIFSVIAILLFFIIYYISPKNIIFHIHFLLILLLIVLVKSDIVIFMIENYLNIYIPNEELVNRILGYADSDIYGSTEKSVLNYISIIIYFSTYIFMYYIIYRNYKFSDISLKRDLFSACIFICILLLCIRFSFAIAFRIGVNYYYLFTCILSVVFTKYFILNKIIKRQAVFAFLILLLIPLSSSYRSYSNLNLEMNAEIYQYKKYYPYSSIINKKFSNEREALYQIRNNGFSIENNY